MTGPGRYRLLGFTLLELMFAIAVIGVLASVALASYRAYALRVAYSAAISDISQIQLAIGRYELAYGRFPNSLADIGKDGMLDPWGTPYRYQNFEGLRGVGSMRKDHNLVPLNSDYDLYSSGPDGDSRMPLSARMSRDDVIRANDGQFLGKASDY